MVSTKKIESLLLFKVKPAAESLLCVCQPVYDAQEDVWRDTCEIVNSEYLTEVSVTFNF